MTQRRSPTIGRPAWKNAVAPGLFAALLIAVPLLGCTPTVKVEAPDKPIVINLNIKIEQEVRIRIEREVEDLIKQNPDIF